MHQVEEEGEEESEEVLRARLGMALDQKLAELEAEGQHTLREDIAAGWLAKERVRCQEQWRPLHSAGEKHAA